VGLLLVTAMLVVPAAASRNLARNAAGLFWWASSQALFASIFGLYLSFVWGSATGATVILVSVALFLGSFIFRVLQRPRLA
jgi:zinc transport system permease protein